MNKKEKIKELKNIFFLTLLSLGLCLAFGIGYLEGYFFGGLIHGFLTIILLLILTFLMIHKEMDRGEKND